MRVVVTITGDIPVMFKSETHLALATPTYSLSWRQRLSLLVNSPKSEHRVSYPYGKLRCLRAGHSD